MLPVTTVSETATVRLLPAAYYKAPVLHALVEHDEDRGLLAAIDALTSRRRRARRVGLPGHRPANELVAYGGVGSASVSCQRRVARFADARSSGEKARASP